MSVNETSYLTNQTIKQQIWLFFQRQKQLFTPIKKLKEKNRTEQLFSPFTFLDFYFALELTIFKLFLQFIFNRNDFKF